MAPVSMIVIGAGARGTVYANYAVTHPEQARVAGVAEPGRRPIQAYRPAAPLARNDVGLETVSRVDIEHLDPLVDQHVRSLDQHRVERQTARIVQVRFRHRCPVNLGF